MSGEGDIIVGRTEDGRIGVTFVVDWNNEGKPVGVEVALDDDLALDLARTLTTAVYGG